MFGFLSDVTCAGTITFYETIVFLGKKRRNDRRQEMVAHSGKDDLFCSLHLNFSSFNDTNLKRGQASITYEGIPKKKKFYERIHKKGKICSP